MERPAPETNLAPAPAPVPPGADAHPASVVIGHTHWDREWYLPFEGFRARLVAMMDGLVDILERDPTFRCFVLDGQSIMVEDYLQVRPEAEPRVRALIGAGRMRVGPWYTAVDAFLPDPESLVRNLQLGRWQARFYGGEPMPVGHLPDTFGFCGQLPQILRHFGIADGFAWRGFHPEHGQAAFWWESPDGSRILLLRPPGGYCEGAMGVVNPERFLQEVLPLIIARQDEEPYKDRLFVVGCDHFPASARLPWLAAQIGERVDQPSYIGTLEDMAGRVRSSGADLAVVHGEQRDPCLAVCPASVSGTRVPLKQANQQVESLLLGLAEPLQALAELAGGEADRAHLRWAWRLLARNHPHDSIPGCSIDAVHREMMTRFARARMVAIDAAQRGAKRLAAALDPAVRGELGALGLVGLTGGVGRIQARLYGMDTGMPRFRLVDPAGADVPFTILRRGRDHISYHRLQDAFATVASTAYAHLVATQAWVDERRTRPETYTLPWMDIEMEVEAPRGGYRILRIERETDMGRWTARRAPRRTQARAEVANQHLRVRAEARGLFITDQAGGRTLGPIYFSHAGEAGDEYTAFPLREPPVLFAPDASRAVVQTDALGEHLVLPISVQVPARLRPDRRARTGAVRLEGRLTVRLVGGRADLNLTLVNRARDYDLRLVAHVPDATSARSGAPFSVENRAFEVTHSSPNAPQQMLPDFPLRGWMAAYTPDGGGLAVLARGLYEGAVRQVEGGVDLALTLLRGVGYLSRGDLESRPGDAGPAIATPDAQCLGPQAWDLALLPFSADEADLVPARTEAFLRPPMIFPVQWSAGHAGAEQVLVTGAPQVVVSALKPAEDGPGAVVHAHNPTGTEHTISVPGTRVRLDETPAPGDGTLAPFQIGAWKAGTQA
jgi:hypothetical protein